MKKIVLIALIALVSLSCGVSRKIEVLEKSNYSIKSADHIYLAGKDVSQLFKNRTFDLSSAPGLALAMLRKNIPLSADINLSIHNPTNKNTSINQFDYIILIKGQEIASGSVAKNINLVSGQTVDVPITINSNIYTFLSNGNTLEELIDFVGGDKSGPGERKSTISIKIRPSFMLGNQTIRYPRYLVFDREISSKILY
jgi:hypothetical protein